MSDVDEMQRWIVGQLRSRRRLDRIDDVRERAASVLTGNDRFLPVEQLEIYRVQFWLRHTSSMLEDYPGVSGILGQREWESLVESYLEVHFSGSWTLRDLGVGFAEHIEARAETPHRELCADMARLEWAYTEVFDAAESEPLDPDRLQHIPPDAWQSALITVSPALRLLRLRHPVAALRRRLKEAAAASSPSEGIDIPDPKRENLAVYRGADRVLYYRKLSDAAFDVLSLLKEGRPLVPACEEAARSTPAAEAEIEAQIGTWFQRWGSWGFIVDVEAPDC